ncbi:non-specific lipid-transfer protein 1-like [Salvia miltiorrhiza]|uniref:non-specific lipid-transfer protein 1-like n=1 Tax=Salvia miltiorrhiza TaxID=226208 RepID=UPI0025AC5984|nr:non-specific lipid-transfer protein 1-like [Salvia miltiorrhiza]
MKGGGVVAVLAIILAVAVQRGEAVSCGQVDAALVPCAEFLTGRAAEAGRACCDGVRAVKGMAVTPADKRAACICIKNAANGFSGLDDSAAQSLPGKCGVTLDIPVSRTVNCDRIA